MASIYMPFIVKLYAFLSTNVYVTAWLLT